MTPDEFDHYIKEAHRMRAETVAVFFSGWMAGLARLFARARSRLRPRGPVAMADKQAQSRVA